MGKLCRHENRYSIIALDRFIQATRDSGYKGTASAISELLDNAVQADATEISITIREAADASEYSHEIAILDNGVGMDAETLRQALRFGGSTRFNDRRGLGRYGMGLPNSSLSQARCVAVYTWQDPKTVYVSYLDVDEIARGEMTDVPMPKKAKLPIGECPSSSGTLVVWSKCDRLDYSRSSTLMRRLGSAIGQKFRYCIWDGVRITMNGNPVHPIDPLFLNEQSLYFGAQLFGEPLEYQIRVKTAQRHRKETGKVRVIFSELPVHDWYKLRVSKHTACHLSTLQAMSPIGNGNSLLAVHRDSMC